MANYKKVTSKDVAKMAGVSQSTVSMILNNSEAASFSQDTVERVFGAAKELGYSINRRRSRVRLPGRSNLVLVVCPSVVNQYYVGLMNTLAFYAQSKGLVPLFFDTFRDPGYEARVAEVLKATPAAGLIYLGTPTLPDIIYQLSQEVPCVLVDEKQEQQRTDRLELDGIRLGTLMGKHLLSLGHRKVAYIAPPMGEPGSPRSRRLEGLRQAFVQEGLGPDSVRSFSIQDEPPGSHMGNEEYAAGLRLAKTASEDSEITAMMGSNDMVAYGIMDALIDLGYQIPQDYSVCGCDNIMFSYMRRISLTTVEHFANEKAKEAVDLLLQRMEAGTPGQSPVRIHRVEYTPQLIVRSSTGPSPRGEVPQE